MEKKMLMAYMLMGKKMLVASDEVAELEDALDD